MSPTLSFGKKPNLTGCQVCRAHGKKNEAMRFLVLAFASMLLVGCTSPTPPTSRACEEGAVSLEQFDLGVSVASVANGAAAIVSALGAQSAIVASDLASDVGVEVINPGHQIAVEKLVKLNPDVIFVGSDEPDQIALDAISTLGAQVVELDPPTSFAQSMEQISLIAEALGVPERGAELREQIQNSIAGLAESELSDSKIAFLYLRGNAGVFLISGSGSGADDLIRLLGARDVGLDLGVRGFAPISPEALAKANPDYIIVMEKGLESVGGVQGLVKLPGITGTKAGQSGGILSAKDSELLSFGPATPKVLSCLIEQAR